MPTEIHGTITTLKDTSGNAKFPRTVSDAITMENGDTLTEVINNIYQLLNNLSLRFSFNFSNEDSASAYGTLVLKSQADFTDGEYNIYWGNNNGKLEEYKPIANFTLNDNDIIKTYEFIKTNAIPKEATKILVIKDNEIKLEYTIPSNKLNTDTKLYSIGLLSDIHIDVTDDESDSVADFQRAVSRFEREGVIAICSSGDTVVDGTQAETNEFIRLKNSTTIPMYIARGNHDCLNYTNSNWNSVEPNGLYFEKEIGGDIYLFMGLNAANYDTTIFSTSQLNWLEERLEIYKERRVFLFEHVFIEPVGNVNNLYPYSSMGKTEGGAGKRFRDLMARYHNVILFTGHSHLEFVLQRLADNANCSERTDILCHRVHIPSCAKPRANEITTPDISANTYAKYGSSEGYVMDVYRDYIILKGINFVEDKYLPLAQYKINTIPLLEKDLLFYLDGSSSENTTSLIKDLSGNGNNFVANNITLDTTNGAIDFNGTSSYLVNETLQSVLTANDIFSFEFIAESNEVRDNAQTVISMGKSSPNRITYRFKCAQGKDDIYTDYGNTSNIDILSTNSGTVDTEFNNKKHHVVIVRRNGELVTYLDGVLNKSVTKASDTTTIEPGTVIGTKYNCKENFFSGKIYMCKLYNKELTANEILEKYNSSILGDPNLLFYLDGSSPKNTKYLIKDLSGNNNNFVANNITLDTTNGAIEFNGTSSYLINETLRPVSTANDIFSVEFVAQSNVLRNESQNIITLGTSSPKRISYRYKREATNNQNIISYYANTSKIYLSSTSSTDLSEKHHVVIVRTEDKLLTYLDGVLNNSVDLPSDTTVIEPRTVIGSKYSCTSEFFSGKIYMFKLYTRKLSADEISNKYNKYNEITQ